KVGRQGGDAPFRRWRWQTGSSPRTRRRRSWRAATVGCAGFSRRTRPVRRRRLCPAAGPSLDGPRYESKPPSADYLRPRRGAGTAGWSRDRKTEGPQILEESPYSPCSLGAISLARALARANSTCSSTQLQDSLTGVDLISEIPCRPPFQQRFLAACLAGY